MQHLTELLQSTKKAWLEYSHFPQEKARAPRRAAPRCRALEPLSTSRPQCGPLYLLTRAHRQVDAIFKAAALAANAQRIPLARMAVKGALAAVCGHAVCACSLTAARAETGMGILEDKVIKNQFAAEIVYNKYKDMKTCDVIESDDLSGVQKVAEPVGVICGVGTLPARAPRTWRCVAA